MSRPPVCSIRRRPVMTPHLMPLFASQSSISATNSVSSTHCDATRCACSVAHGRSAFSLAGPTDIPAPTRRRHPVNRVASRTDDAGSRRTSFARRASRTTPSPPGEVRSGMHSGQWKPLEPRKAAHEFGPQPELVVCGKRGAGDIECQIDDGFVSGVHTGPCRSARGKPPHPHHSSQPAGAIRARIFPARLAPMPHRVAPYSRRARIDIEDRESRLFANPDSQEGHSARVMHNFGELDFLPAKRYIESRDGGNCRHRSRSQQLLRAATEWSRQPSLRPQPDAARTTDKRQQQIPPGIPARGYAVLGDFYDKRVHSHGEVRIDTPSG